MVVPKIKIQVATGEGWKRANNPLNACYSMGPPSPRDEKSYLHNSYRVSL